MRNTNSLIRITVLALLAAAAPLGLNTAQAADTSAANVIEKKLDYKVSMMSDEIHLEDALDFIGEQYGIDFIVDNRVVRPKEANRIDPDTKYETDGMIPRVTIKGVSLREALDSLLGPLGLSHSVQGSAVWITTPAHQLHESFEDLETRFYELQQGPEVMNRNADLEDVALEPINLVNLLRHVVPEILEPTTEKRLSYMRFNDETKTLVVYDAPSNHRIIQQLLKLLDRPV